MIGNRPRPERGAVLGIVGLIENVDDLRSVRDFANQQLVAFSAGKQALEDWSDMQAAGCRCLYDGETLYQHPACPLHSKR
jgi:hypothetical protein